MFRALLVVLCMQVVQTTPLHNSPQGLLRTSNDAFNKLGTVLSYLAFHITSMRSEVCHCPMAPKLVP